ncbi:MAG TPA: YMGG-like glycine zipper-containing protein [Pyrinomonadaceae bacterium]|nr:YMGG-like glycine zipper-containing protein [Pyrinomonadaceae bacterium]
MNRVRQIISACMVLAMLSLSIGVQAQTTRRRPAYRNSANQTQRLLTRLETNAERFRLSLSQSLDQSRLDGTRREENISNVLDDFNHIVDHVRERNDRQQLIAADVEALLARASRLDRFMTNRGNRVTTAAQNDWAALRTDLDQLAGMYNVAWNRTNTVPYSTYPPTDNNSYNYDTGLTGTYRLNVAQSEDPRREAQLATNGLPMRERRRTLDLLMARLESPTELAIERRGDNVTIASTRAPQINFVADGTERVERGTNGNTIRARAAFNGDQLIVNSMGDLNNDFSVTFDPLNNGRRLQVTRRINVPNVTAPVVVRSIYDRTADVARFDIYRGGGSTYPTTTGTIGSSNDSYIITNGTTLIATLNTDLNTRNSREGDRFTMTVREPSQYAGATIEGHVSQVNRSGRVTGRSALTFNFDRIRISDGRTYNFSGFVENVRTVNGETVRVDNEGTVQDSNRTDTTVQRTAVGTAVGAIIGAIAGGGKGAAIGAVLGAGGGAGSVYIQGSDDLDLRTGTEVTIRTSTP